MSNNDLRCSKCGSQHHPVECPARSERERLIELTKKAKGDLCTHKPFSITTCCSDCVADVILKEYIQKEELLERLPIKVFVREPFPKLNYVSYLTGRNETIDAVISIVKGEK